MGRRFSLEYVSKANPLPVLRLFPVLLCWYQRRLCKQSGLLPRHGGKGVIFFLSPLFHAFFSFPFLSFFFLKSVEVTFPPAQPRRYLLRHGETENPQSSALFFRTLLSAQPYHPSADGGPAGKYQMAKLGAAVRDVRILLEQVFKAVIKIPQRTIQDMFETCGNAENSNRK